MSIAADNPFVSFDFFAGIKNCIKEAVESLVPDTKHKLNNTEVQITREFENQSAVDVTIVDRNNMVFDYHSTAPRYKGDGKFIIRDTYKFESQSSLKRFYENLLKRKDHKGHHGQLTEWIIKEISGKLGPFNDYRNVPYTFGIQYAIDTKELDKQDWLYLSNADLMIARTEKANNLLHIGSDLGNRENVLKSFFQNQLKDGITHAVVYDIIDDEHKTNHVYCNLSVDGKEVTKIKPKRTVAGCFKKGVFRSVITRDSTGDLDIKTEHVPFEESAKLGIYTSHEDALTNGNVNLLLEKEIAAANVKITAMKNETAIQQEKITQLEQKHKEKNITTADQREEANLNNHLLKTVLEQLKGYQELERNMKENEMRLNKSRRDDEFEKKSQKRKDKSEKMKFGFSIAASVATLVLGLFTFFKRA